MACNLEGMREEDIPPKRTLRDILYKKIRHSTIMRFDLSLYEQFPDSDYRKTYDLLMSFIVMRVKLDREQKNMLDKEKAWSEITNPKPGAPATKAEKEKAKKKKEKQEKEKKEKEKKEQEKKDKEKKEKEKEEEKKKRNAPSSGQGTARPTGAKAATELPRLAARLFTLVASPQFAVHFFIVELLCCGGIPTVCGQLLHSSTCSGAGVAMICGQFLRGSTFTALALPRLAVNFFVVARFTAPPAEKLQNVFCCCASSLTVAKFGQNPS